MPESGNVMRLGVFQTHPREENFLPAHPATATIPQIKYRSPNSGKLSGNASSHSGTQPKCGGTSRDKSRSSEEMIAAGNITATNRVTPHQGPS